MDSFEILNLSARDFKVVVLGKEKLPKHNLQEAIVHSSDIHELKTILEKNESSDIVFVCPDNQLTDVTPLLKANSNISIIYLVTDLMYIWWPTELESRNLQTIKINNQKELMQHLCLQVMMCYFRQGEDFKEIGDWGLANRCFIDAQNALKQLKRFL